METISRIPEIEAKSNKIRLEGKSIGFVPTMGALHEGHLSLVREAKRKNDVVIVSIFINPTQFNNPEDLKNYPRSPEEDRKMLEECGVNILFTPDSDEIYGFQNELKTKVHLDNLENVMEGKFRPGHFNGVVDIVSRLFKIINPDSAYFGKKDFQQLAVINRMNQQIGFPVKIIACETVREKNGLAMSSRNLRLSKEGFDHAAEISSTLFFLRENRSSFTPVELIAKATGIIEKDERLKVEYIEIAEEENLKHYEKWEEYKSPRLFAAVFCEGIRLIDNVALY